MDHRSILFLIVLLSLSLLSCGKKDQQQSDLATFRLKGEVIAIDTAAHRVTISHEEIPNYMMAMTMPFKVKNPALLNGITVGDSVIATLAVSRVESWLETLTVSKKGEKVEIQTPAEIQLRHLFQAGEALPDEQFTNQDGETIRLSGFRGRALAITFIYTRCPLPDYCPRMSDNFTKIQKDLSKDRSLDGKWHLISISFDPEFDTPRVLKGYAKGYGANLATWDFATGSAGSIGRFADGFDLSYAKDEGLFQHNLRTVLVDREGKLVEVVKGNDWNVNEVEARLKELATGTRQPA